MPAAARKSNGKGQQGQAKRGAARWVIEAHHRGISKAKDARNEQGGVCGPWIRIDQPQRNGKRETMNEYSEAVKTVRKNQERARARTLEGGEACKSFQSMQKYAIE